ncbi:copper chaperone PCu(A)C [Deinococcus caeni]|uniref:Copper chaperone PCu(A)C n=1 Tax=Deinococcus caeni TaxID=569127 RepID=A0ABP9UED9_9DEIO
MTAPAHPPRRSAAALALLTLLALSACGPRAASEPAAGRAPSVQADAPDTTGQDSAGHDSTSHDSAGHDMAGMDHAAGDHGSMNHGAASQGAAPAAPANAAPLPLTVTDGRVVAVPPGVTDTSVFATLTNTGPDDIQLSGVSSPAATGGLLMITRTDAAGLTGMSGVDTLTVPAGGTLTLSDTGDHLMLSGLKAPLQAGERLSLTLTDTQGRALTLDLPVLKP